MARKLLMIGLDAAESGLIDAWTADGTLPVLQELRRGGSYTKLGSTAEWLVGSPWVAFYTGQSPAEHGIYHSIVWRPDRLDHVRATAEVRDALPFWRALSRQGPRVIAFDVPLTQTPEPFNGIEINGWANTDLLDAECAYPAGALQEVAAAFGRPDRPIENYRLETAEALLALRDQQIATTRHIGQAAGQLLRGSSWDFAIVGIHTAHYAGHKLWSVRNVVGEVTPSEADELGSALRQVYKSCDGAVGQLVEAAGPGTDVLVFAVHGMGPNVCRTDFLGEMLHRVMARQPVTARSATETLAHRARNLLPQSLRYAVKSRLPRTASDRLTVYWRTGTRDWSSTQAFNLFSDLIGYVRVNMEGREAQGRVRPEAADELLDEILEGLRSFVDADTGEPLVLDHRRRSDLYPDGQRRDLLPDMMLRWSDRDAALHRGFGSPRFGDIPWPTPGRHYTGRSGNHRGPGFLIAAGPSLRERLRPDAAHILDLAPTVHDLLDIPAPPHFDGRSLLRRAALNTPSAVSAT
jgi:predicted AlkP superfamily phosphohydrolase/phosphomutase